MSTEKAAGAGGWMPALFGRRRRTDPADPQPAIPPAAEEPAVMLKPNRPKVPDDVGITFIQTADAFGYKPMLDETSRAVIEYCRRHGFNYESFTGIRRGVHPWQASFNRIPMLQQMVREGYRGWVIYLDADAYVYQMDFDLRAYLRERNHHSAVLTPIPGQDIPWNINDGVMMVNLGHPLGREIVRRWYERFMQVSDATLEELVAWPQDINDQTFLAQLLEADVPLRESVYYERAELINSCYAQFIRQLLRAHFPQQGVRANAIRNAIADILPEQDDFVDRAYPVLMSALLRGVMGRDPVPGELEHHRPRFDQLGIELGFRVTLEEFLASRPQQPVPAAARVRAAFRWIAGEVPSDEIVERYAARLESGELDIAALRALLLRDAGLVAASARA